MPALHTKTSICNMALTALNVGTEIANVDTENTAEAAAFRRVYNTALEVALSSFEWPFAGKQLALGLVTDDVDGDEWGYAYTYPADCLHARRILGLSSGHSVPHDGQGGAGRIPYKIAQLPEAAAGADIKVILTDQSEAVLDYTKAETDASRYPADFALALSYLLAALVAPRIAGATSSAQLRAESLALYQKQLDAARARAAAEEASELTDKSEFSNARL